MFYTWEMISEIHNQLLNGQMEILKDIPFKTALSEDRKDFVALRNCRIKRNKDGTLNHFFPNQDGEGEDTISGLIWSCRAEDGTTSISGYPAPDGLDIEQLAFGHDQLEIVCATGEILQVTKLQLTRGLVTMTFGSFTMSELYDAFIKCPDLEVRKGNRRAKLPDVALLASGLELSYNPQKGQYEGCTKEVSLILSAQSKGDLEVAKQRLEDIVLKWDEYIEAAKEFAARELLGLKNEVWTEEGEEPVTAGDFVKRITLQTISSAQTTCELLFDDDDLFWGHNILITVEEETEFRRADIVG